MGINELYAFGKEPYIVIHEKQLENFVSNRAKRLLFTVNFKSQIF